MNLQSLQWTQDAVYLRKHKESGGLVQRASFIEKHNDFSGVGESDMKIYSRNEAQAHFTWENKTISPRSAGVTCKFTVKMKARRILRSNEK